MNKPALDLLCHVHMRYPTGALTDNYFRDRLLVRTCVPEAVRKASGRRGDPTRCATRLEGDNFWTVIPVSEKNDELDEFDNPYTSLLLMDCLRYICAMERLGASLGND